VAAAVIGGESRSAPLRGAMSVEQIERELARLRMTEDETLGARASVLNLIVVTDEESAPGVTRVVCELSGRYPSRAMLMISDPEEDKANLEVGLSAFCRVRGSRQVCAEQITMHIEGPPAEHLESLAGPLLIPDLPVFLWYPNGGIPPSPECGGMAALADRLILDSDSGATGDCEAVLRGAADLSENCALAVGDLQWAALSPWRSLLANLFAPPERAGELEKIRHAEVLHGSDGECEALLFVSWLSAALNWRSELVERLEGGRMFHFTGSSGEVAVEFASNAPEAGLHRVRLFSEELVFQIEVFRHKEHTNACLAVTRDDELISERTVHLGSSSVTMLLGEELKILGRDEVYEAAIERAAEMLDL
jgi:glucose-6-phosphate dehydrogenase assembly protein OpcA